MKDCHKKMSLLILFLLSLSAFSSPVFPPVDQNGVKRIDLDAQSIIEEYIKKTPSTKSMYFNQQTGQYAEQRLALHQKIITEIIQNKPCVNKKQTVALFTAGLAGSGKTTFLKKHIKDINQYVHIDADEIREKLPEYKGWNAINTQEEVTDIINEVFNQLEKHCENNIIYDGSLVGQKYINTAIHFKKLGYKIYVVYVQIPVTVAKERTLKRYQKTGRYVSADFIIYVSQRIANSFTKMKSYLDGYVIVDGISGKIIEEKNFNLPKQSPITSTANTPEMTKD
ncbi:zeta toxin family protein [Legionella maioricensis]|uniref:Zeta toxin family protein n=1 Tax=Legionella maioricensis TaxID=2896528 RepID=A0A9X2IAB4_9GAMM|nr:zeta toxin family protein [Legionella maioricensis]MCL9683884.1 zeta toxin family protein [Legionella maioricensis]MCL9686731.1 zeta toxin family protein [Legionella maioricensis]